MTMTKSDNARVVETSAFFTFWHNYDDLSAFCALTLGPMNVWSNITQENLSIFSRAERQAILPMADAAKTGKNIAANLAIVYLVTIMEAYVTDAVYELLNQRIRQVNLHLFGNPVPTNEDEDVLIDLQLEEADADRTRPLHLISELSRERVRSLLYHFPVKRGLQFLEKRFNITVEDKDSHEKNWKQIRETRHSIVHRKSSPEYKDSLQRPKAQSDSGPVIEPEYVSEALTQVFEFAHAIEKGIVVFRHREKSSSETPA
jgi:hypothetical protein